MKAQCVRCGRGERADGTFLCEPCLRDPESERQALEAIRVEGDGIEARRFVIERYHWAGGWGRPGARV